MTRFQRLLLFWSSALTAMTGLVYWWMDAMLEPVNEWAVVNHPLQPWVLKAHIVVAPVLVFAIGLIATDHIWKHFRTRVKRGRRSGLAAMWVIVPMVLTGYLIQAITHELWLTVVAWIHIVTGLVYAVGLLAHRQVIRRNGTKRRNGGTGREGASRTSRGDGDVVPSGRQVMMRSTSEASRRPTLPLE